MTYILGLTGGIGMGKTTISNFLQTLGFKILDADVIARKVVEPATPGLAELQKTFGPQIIQTDQTLDRAKLGKIVFSDPKKLAQLDQIMQPLIRAEYEKQLTLAEQKGCKVVVIDAALLFENGYADHCDAVINVEVPKAVQLKRIIERDHLSEEAALERITSQMSAEKRRKLATITVDSSGTVEETQAQVIKWLEINNLIEN
ncbi:dephospho-CoA kinase [uncultured Ligilactobacillus sp.]|uniref:dephospho-CoA kinase n=1 Tax=uncultured Ligilactobacillus sp. TaxID=2837633 RepID=UPI00272A5B9A|nr:dephospho-CoA kinase [uncultured Ligilactobacillus sp.]